MENKELVLKAENEKTALAYLDAFCGTNKLTEFEKKMFTGVCKEMGLNPFKREVYITSYGEGDRRQFSIITGYEVYLKRAEASGLLEYWNVHTEGDLPKTNNIEEARKSTFKAVIKIKRKDRPEFVHEVYFSEYFQIKSTKKQDNTYVWELNSMWKNKPVTMIKKVVIGQGFRLYFPLELAGMPYIEEEVGEKAGDVVIDENTTVIQKPKTKTEAKENTATGVDKPVFIEPEGQKAVVIDCPKKENPEEEKRKEDEAKQAILDEEKRLAELEKKK